MTSNNHGPAGLVREFHEAFDLGAPHKPLDRIPPGLAKLRDVLHGEEFDEWNCALDETLVSLVKEACDLAYVAIGTCVALGVDFEAAFRVVHESNMAKLWPDGKPRWRRDGKVLKPDDWEPVDPDRLIGRKPGDLPTIREAA